MRENLHNTGLLIRLIMRRERLNTTMWIVLTVGIIVLLSVGLEAGLDAASRLEVLPVLENPAMIAMVGPIIGMANFTHGAMFTTFMLLFTAIAVVVMNVMLVVRHTRADEEKGRYEVVRSLPTGRLAHLNATMISAVIINVVLAVLTGIGLFLLGDYSMDFNGSMLLGALLGVSGLVFAAIAAVFSQLSSSSRGAMGYSLFVMGAFYMIRAVGDVGVEVLSLINPLGLILRAEPFVGDYWWPVFVLLGVAVPITLLAYRLNLTRDIDQGILPDKQGKAEGGKLLRTPFGLTIKLTGTSVIVGLVTIFSIAAAYGIVISDIDGFFVTNEFYRQLIMWMDGISMPLLFAGMINFIAAMIALIPMLMYVLRARGEEKEVRAELVIATPVSRSKYLAGYTIIAFASSVAMQFLTALGLWMSAVSVLPNPDEFPLGTVLTANLVYLPALWVIIAVAVFLIGVFPKATGMIWAVYGVVFLLGVFGRLDIFPAWIQNITPLGYVPQYPMEAIGRTSMIVLTAVAGGLTAIGFVGFRRRDITAI